MPPASVGDQEMLILRHVAEHGAVSAGDAARFFGREHGLARSTVLTMLERLRGKGLLVRRVVAGVYRYRAKASSRTLLRTAVQRFVEGHLGGSISPVVAYLAETPDLSDEDVRDLQAIVERLQAERREP